MSSPQFVGIHLFPESSLQSSASPRREPECSGERTSASQSGRWPATDLIPGATRSGLNTPAHAGGSPKCLIPRHAKYSYRMKPMLRSNPGVKPR